ncbi:hypothetical protein ACQCVE_08720 [Metabacillus sp. 113a]|uniref:hypothetical protein n=1 Tax=Metabacillus sp. 113a TaxID=3404706 RepID=UPI003CF3CA21
MVNGDRSADFVACKNQLAFRRAKGISKITGYSTGASDEEGEIGEIAKYSPDNQKFYLVNGKTQTVDIVSLSGSYTVICH